MTDLRKQIEDAVGFLQTRTALRPPIGIILGTGLGGLAREITADVVIDYAEIPHFPLSTVESHHGKLIFGTLAGKRVVAMQGRFHYYEGYTLQQVTFPVRVMKFLGVGTLLISNAAGGMNPNFSRGSIMIITDHINLLGDNPLIGPNDDTLGPRFPDMSEPYSRELITMAEEVALDMKIRTERGVFVAVPGPNLETRAEYRFLRMIGADAVGMSTLGRSGTRVSLRSTRATHSAPSCAPSPVSARCSGTRTTCTLHGAFAVTLEATERHHASVRDDGPGAPSTTRST